MRAARACAGTATAASGRPSSVPAAGASVSPSAGSRSNATAARSARARPTSTAKARPSNSPSRPTRTERHQPGVALAVRGRHLAAEEAHVLRVGAPPEAHDEAPDAERPIAFDAGADLVRGAGQRQLGTPLEEGELVEHRLASPGSGRAVERDGRERLLRDQDVRRVTPDGAAVSGQDLSLVRD